MKSDIKIEKNIPLPLAKTVFVFPWDQMEVGDSFVTTAHSATVRLSAKQANVNITCRIVPEGYRVWRTA